MNVLFRGRKGRKLLFHPSNFDAVGRVAKPKRPRVLVRPKYPWRVACRAQIAARSRNNTATADPGLIADLVARARTSGYAKVCGIVADKARGPRGRLVCP